MTKTNNIEVIEVALAVGGSKWIVKVNGTPVANYRTRKGAERKAASL